jgi:hypothetical protein
MKLAAFSVKPWLTGGVVENDFMAVMTVFRVIAVRSVEVMAFIANTICAFERFMPVIISMRPPGPIRSFAAVRSKMTL